MAMEWYERNIETMPEGATRLGFDLPAYIRRHSMRWTIEQGPPSHWWAGAPLGNGDFGALMYGPPENLTFILGKNDLWVRRCERSFFPDESFEEILRIYRENDREAFWPITQRPRVESITTSSLTNAGFLRLHLAEPAIVWNWRQELSLYEATALTHFRSTGQIKRGPVKVKYELTSLVSQLHEVLAVNIRSEYEPLDSLSWSLGRAYDYRLPACRPGFGDGLFWIEQELLKGDRYAVAACQVGLDARLGSFGHSVLGEAGAVTQNEATFYVACASGNDSDDPLALACERVQAAAQAGFEAVHDEHKRHWAGFWQRSQVYCAEAEAERSWYRANYLSGSIMRPGKTSSGLQGIWARENIPAWGADFHGNINMQAMYWGTLSSNHMELFEPYAALYHRMLPQCRKDAREYFHAEGARLPHAGDIDGFEMTGSPSFMLGVALTPSGWIAQLFWWYYQNSLDQEYLAEVAYPVLRDTALFNVSFLDRMERDEEGKYLVEPTLFFEHNVYAFDAWGLNSAYDVPIIKTNLEEAAAAARILGVDDLLVARWEKALADLPELGISPEGAWEKWVGRGRIDCEFAFPVFPCEYASEFHGPEHLREAARKTWEAFHAMKPDAWCGGMPVGAAARMGDTEWALEAACDRGEPIANGLVCGPTHDFMQCDHGPGMSMALNSMMLQHLGGNVILFPGMPTRVDAGFNSLRTTGAVLVSAEQRGGRVRYAAFCAPKGGVISVLNPFGEAGAPDQTQVRVRCQDCGDVVVDAGYGYRAPLSWTAKPGKVYILEAVAEPFEQIAVLELTAPEPEDEEAQRD